jgi:hypothetical protein
MLPGAGDSSSSSSSSSSSLSSSSSSLSSSSALALPTAGIASSLQIERIGQSLEILRSILSPGGGGVQALFSGAEVNLRSLVPSFLCLFAARVAVHAVFGRSRKAKIRRVRRDAFVRLFFEKAKAKSESS